MNGVSLVSYRQTAPSGLGSQVQLNVEVLCQELTSNIVKLEKIQNNLQKLLENGDWVTSCWGQHNTSHSPLKKVLLLNLSCAPCWPEVQDAENPDVFALGGLQLRKQEGRGGMSLLLCNKSWPCLCCCLKITSREVSKVLEDTCSDGVMVNTALHAFLPFLSLLFRAFFTHPNQPSDLRGTTVYQQTQNGPLKN